MLVPFGGATLPRAQMARPANGARLTLATWLQPRPDRPATIPLPPDVTVRIGRVDGQAPANSASVHTVGLNSREQAAVWKAKADVAGRHSCGPSGCLSEAGRSSGQPEARSGADRGLRRARWPRPEPPCFPHRHSEHKDLLS